MEYLGEEVWVEVFMFRKCMNCGCYSNQPLNEQFCSRKCYDQFADELNNIIKDLQGN
jgi:protein-arginine kinase activator protein McsA